MKKHLILALGLLAYAARVYPVSGPKNNAQRIHNATIAAAEAAINQIVPEIDRVPSPEEDAEILLALATPRTHTPYDPIVRYFTQQEPAPTTTATTLTQAANTIRERDEENDEPAAKRPRSSIRPWTPSAQADNYLMQQNPTTTTTTTTTATHMDNDGDETAPTGPTQKLKKYLCPYCSSAFAQKCQLDNHTRTHTGEKPYKCTHEGCDFASAQKHNLHVHRLKHLPEQPFKCTVPGCGQGFNRQDGLNNHMNAHLPEKPYKCSVPGCGKGYNRPDALKEHMNTHLPEKPYKCEVAGCSYASARKFDVTKHTKNQHSQ